MFRLSCVGVLIFGLTAEAAGLGPGPSIARARGQSQTPLPVSALPLELVGVMVDSAAPRRSACLVRCTYPNERRSASLLDVGATACDIAEIKEVRQDGVVIRNLLTNRLETLTLKTPGDSPPARASKDARPADPAVVNASPDLVSVDLPKASVEHYLLNLPDLLRSAQATPRYVDGAGGQRTIEGFEIGQIREGSVVEKLGLKNGDVIVEVNGEPLDSLATVIRLFGQAQATTQAKLTVLRGTQRMTFVFNTK